MCPTERVSPRPLRVLYVIDALGPGGTEKQLANLVRNLDRGAVVPHLCTLRPSESDLRAIGCEVVELPFRSFASPGAATCLRRLRRFIRDRRIDLVQAFFQDPTILAWAATIGSRTVRVGSFRDMGFWRTRWKAAQLRHVYPRYHGFVANSRAVAQRFHELERIPLGKITVVYNGVEVPGDTVAPRRGDHPVVGIVANLNRPVKRVDLFLRAAALVATERPDARFVIVGDGHLRPALERLCSDLGLMDSVTFHGRVPDPSAELRRFDIGVLTSDSEGLSNAILEYLAHGIPVVARRVGGNAEVVTEGETGLLIDGDEPAAVASAVTSLLRAPDVRSRMGDRGRAVARDRFSFEACARAHEACYRRLAAQEP